MLELEQAICHSKSDLSLKHFVCTHPRSYGRSLRYHFSLKSSTNLFINSQFIDEIIQLIFFELNDPSHLILASKRFLHFSQDPYVRAHYFLSRYGHIQAMYWALGRGKIINERVLDVRLCCVSNVIHLWLILPLPKILLSSGAQFSRYLIQVATHHYFRTTSHFIKSHWVRSVPFPVFAYFLKLAAERYGEIPCGKGDDDGTMFSTFLKESRFPAGMKSTSWEEIRDILEKFNV